MTNQLRRQLLRDNGIDIEILAVGEADGKGGWRKTGKYRYTISIWGDSGSLVRNNYSDKLYDTYVDAENTAIHIANLELAKYSL